MTLAALRNSAAHVFVASLEQPVVDDVDLHHLRRVLRVRDTDTVSASDGNGRWRLGRLHGDLFVPDGPINTTPERPLVTIATAIPKGDRLEWMVQKLTELGVGRIRLVEFARSVVRWGDERAPKQMSRLGRIVREAAMQSRQVELPVLDGPVPFAALLAEDPAAIALADPAGESLRPRRRSEPSWRTIVIGPEGGFSADESSCGATAVSLSPHVLRVETAAVAAAVLLGAASPDDSTVGDFDGG